MQTTTNIGLKTYEANDPTDWLGEFNYNMNKIDEAVGSQNDAIDVIEETAGTAVTTANTASATATEALTTAESKTSVNDNVASATTTYSSNKINELIEGAGGAVIDDSTTSLTSTWSSSKINTEVSSANKFPNYNSAIAVVDTTEISASGEMSLTYTTVEDCYIRVYASLATSLDGKISIQIGNNFIDVMKCTSQPYGVQTGRMFKVKANTVISVTAYGVTGNSGLLMLQKISFS